MKDRHKFLIASVVVLLLISISHVLSVKRMEDNKEAEKILLDQINEQQKIIDITQSDVVKLRQALIGLRGDAVVIDNKLKENKNKYKDEKKHIDFATPSQQSSLLSTNLAEFKNLDRQGYFDLPE